MTWLTGWRYRQKLRIPGQPGASTNYQVMLIIRKGSRPFSSMPGVYLNNNSASFPTGKDDGGDLRFTTDDGETLLNFWVEYAASDQAMIRVKVTADLDTEKSIYCYYGNSAATNASNGANTFIFFDDFSGSSVDTAKWDLTNAPSTYSVDSSILSMTGADTAKTIDSKSVFGYDLAFVWRQKFSDRGSLDAGVELFGEGTDLIGVYPPGFNAGMFTSQAEAALGPANMNLNSTSLVTDYSTCELMREGDDSLRMIYGGWNIQTVGWVTTDKIPKGDLGIRFHVYTDELEMSTDFVYVRKHVWPEPLTDLSSLDQSEEDLQLIIRTLSVGEAMATPNTNLLLHFGGHSLDASGNNNDGVETDITYSQANGKFGQGADFNGSSSYISSAFSNTSDEMTISAWFKCAVSNTSNKTITSQWGDTNKDNWWFMVARNNHPTFPRKLAFLNRLASSGGENIFYSISNVDTNEWIHGVVVVKSGSSAIYINGSLETSYTTAYTVTKNTAEQFYIGRERDGSYFNGSIDELIIEDRAWTAEEIRKYYNNVRGFYSLI